MEETCNNMSSSVDNLELGPHSNIAQLAKDAIEKVRDGNRVEISKVIQTIEETLREKYY